MSARHCVYSVSCENVFKTNLFTRMALPSLWALRNYLTCHFMVFAKAKIQCWGVRECCKCCHFPNLILLIGTVKFRSSVYTHCASVLPVFQTYLSCTANAQCSTIYGTERQTWNLLAEMSQCFYLIYLSCCFYLIYLTCHHF